MTLVVLTLTYFTLPRYQSRIEKMAVTDKLTGLLNRHAFAVLIDKLLAAARRHPQPISFLLADIDHFKSINDSHGHRVGDQVLGRIADILRSTLREADFAVRWGGEEFLLVLPGCTAVEGLSVAEKLRAAVAQAQPEPENPALRVTISVGVAELADGETPEQSINRADKALYAAKQAGRNTVRRAEAVNA